MCDCRLVLAAFQEQLMLQRLREVPLCQPTWFCAREVFDNVGGYVEDHPNQVQCDSEKLTLSIIEA